jgi:hypothetical protein
MKYFSIIVLVIISYTSKAQITNYVYNPSFEIDILAFNGNDPFNAAKYWGPIDSTFCAAYYLMGKPPVGAAPYNPTGFQYPRTGNNLLEAQFYCNTCPRWYPRNRLKQILKPNITYCAKYHIVNTNYNLVGIGSYGMYFGDSSIDTITKCQLALPYLIPQIENQNGIISDTLNWTPISGTFVATGTEKYMILGNFKSNAATTTIALNPTTLTVVSNDIYIDDVSLIELELPAYAGRDTSIIPGDSLFIGREPDIGIDEACMWYKLPTVITPTTPAIDTIAGFWIKPVTSCTYIVRQQLWCNNSPKWDTVVIHMNPVGIEKLKLISEELKLFPVPAKDEIQLSIYHFELIKEFHSLSIFNNLGLLIRAEETKFENGSLKIKTEDLPNGVYSFQLKSSSNETVSKRFVISR